MGRDVLLTLVLHGATVLGLPLTAAGRHVLLRRLREQRAHVVHFAHHNVRVLQAQHHLYGVNVTARVRVCLRTQHGACA